MGFTFKKNKMKFGYHSYDIKHKREYIGQIGYSYNHEHYKIMFRIEDKDNTKGWDWIVLNRKDKNINIALEWLKKEDVFQKIMNNEKYKIFHEKVDKK